VQDAAEQWGADAAGHRHGTHSDEIGERERERESMTSTESTPIACTLAPGDFKDRVASIRELSARSLRSHRRDGLMLELSYDRCAAADVHELVHREQACCGFLRFDVRESADAVHLTITAPPEAQGAADELFAHFGG
jgi:hypothetical protein